MKKTITLTFFFATLIAFVIIKGGGSYSSDNTILDYDPNGTRIYSNTSGTFYISKSDTTFVPGLTKEQRILMYSSKSAVAIELDTLHNFLFSPKYVFDSSETQIIDISDTSIQPYIWVKPAIDTAK